MTFQGSLVTIGVEGYLNAAICEWMSIQSQLPLDHNHIKFLSLDPGSPVTDIGEWIFQRYSRARSCKTPAERIHCNLGELRNAFNPFTIYRAVPPIIE
jgi:hypothetical protein